MQYRNYLYNFETKGYMLVEASGKFAIENTGRVMLQLLHLSKLPWDTGIIRVRIYESGAVEFRGIYQTKHTDIKSLRDLQSSVFWGAHHADILKKYFPEGLTFCTDNGFYIDLEEEYVPRDVLMTQLLSQEHKEVYLATRLQKTAEVRIEKLEKTLITCDINADPRVQHLQEIYKGVDCLIWFAILAKGGIIIQSCQGLALSKLWGYAQSRLEEVTGEVKDTLKTIMY